MKIRKGFVSNSSSSSFLIYGIGFPVDDDGLTNLEEYEKVEDIELKEDTFLKLIYTPFDMCYLGLSWADIKDNETGAEFKKRIEDELKRLLPNEKLNIKTIKEAWRDG